MSAFIEAASPHTMNTYGRLPIALSRGQGCRVWDINGKEYLDALAGIAVNTLGHNHPEFAPALQDQISKIIHTCNYFHVPDAEKLAAKLVELSGMTNVFFCNSGLEANEAAIKLARKFGHDKGITNPKIVVYEKAFHGRSIATLSATANVKLQQGFGPMLEGFVRVPLNDIEALKKATLNDPDVVAVFFETIQGEGGINPMRADYLRDVRAICDRHNVLLFLDEIQTGLGRTGKMWAFEHEGIRPDCLTVAKALGGGVYPVSAFCADDEVMNVFQPGDHGSTFGGNPMAAAVGKAALDVLIDEGLPARAAELGSYFKARLTALNSPHVREVRGRGLLIGVELHTSSGAARPYCERLSKLGVLCKDTHGQVIRFAPPLVIERDEIDFALEQVAKVLT